jgi:hypothetical protein
MRVTPPLRRSTVRQANEGLEVLIPAKRNPFLILFLTAWLVGWCFGEVFAIRELLTGHNEAPDLFLGVWLVMWTVGGGAALYAWLWMVKGVEVILLRSDTLAIRRDVLGFGRTKEYDLSHVRNLRVAPNNWNPYDWSGAMQFWGVGGGLVAFDYGSRTFRFAASVDEAEARDIVNQLNARHSFPGPAA